MADVHLTSDASLTASELVRAAAQVRPRIEAVVRRYGVILLARVKAHAAGRPGPRMVTGDYNRSIALNVASQAAGGVSAVVGTNRPQGRRLEFGFTGTDSLGRTYSQPPYPHFGPALDEVRPEFQAAVGDIIKGL